MRGSPRPAVARHGPTGGHHLGVCAQLATSDGGLVLEGRYGRRAATRLAVAQRALATKRRGSSRRDRAVAQVASAHRLVPNQRQDLAHKLSRALVNGYDLIVHEDLKITNMVRRPRPRKAEDDTYEPNGAGAEAGLNRSISDAGWGHLLHCIAYKAEEAGRVLIAVDPATAPNAARRAGTPPRATGSPRPSSDASRVDMRPTPTSMRP